MLTTILSGRWLPLGTNTVLQSLFVLAAAAIALACTTKASAARRHLISLAALGALLLIPVMSRLIPAPKPLLQVSGPGLTLRRSPLGRLSAPLQTTRSRAAGAAPVRAEASVAAAMPASPVSPAVPPVILSPQVSVGAATAAASLNLARFAPWTAAVWLIGVLLVMGRLMVGLDRIRRMTRQSEPELPEALQTQISALLSEVGFARPLAVVQASSRTPISVPMTWGVRKATLLLPAEAAQWPAERLRVVLLHELAHIRRHDWLTQTFGQFVCALYWFHPLVWRLNRHSRIEAERACDDAVLLAGVRAKEYAAHLLDVVRAMQASREAPAAAVAMARPTQVRYRLQSILDARRSRRSATRPVLTLVLTATVLLLVAASQLRPLAWAGALLQAQDSGRLPAIGPVVTLPDGLSVELVAVGTKPPEYGEGDWWTTDGKPVWDLPREETIPFASRENGYPDRLLRRALFFRIQAGPSIKTQLSFSTTGYVVDPTRHLQTSLYRYGRNDRTQSWILPLHPTAGSLLLGLPQTDTHCTYRLGIASGPWETIATTRFSLHPAPNAISIPATALPDQTSLLQDDTPRIFYRDRRGAAHSLSLLGGHAPLGDVARRVVAIDKNGKEVYTGSSRDGIKGGEAPFPLWAQAHVVELRLQVRPYQWAEFKDIVLKPAMAPKPPTIAMPSVLPAFRHLFACGVTLDALAVTEKHTDGGQWWRPDGKRLAGALKEYEGLMGSSSAWKRRVRPRGLVLRLTSPRTLSVTSAIRFVPSVPDGNDEMLPGVETTFYKGRPLSDSTVHDFPSNLQSAALRYGIAAGPWRTVAHIAAPTDARRTVPEGDPDETGVDLEVYGFPQAGEAPRLRYHSAAGSYRDLPFQVTDTAYISDVARRFVAVDNEGHILPLKSNNGSQSTLDKAGNPIPLDPANAGRTDLVVGDYLWREMDMVNLSFSKTGWKYGVNPVPLAKIREFRLQIRPYEWAEFRNIALQPTKGGP